MTVENLDPEMACILLEVCQTAEETKGSGKVRSVQGIGYSYPYDPTLIESDDGRDACVLHSIGNNVIIAYRGTHGLDDWINDIFRCGPVRNQGDYGPKVHEGFLNAVNQLQNDMSAALQNRVNLKYQRTGVTPDIYVTGHSKGGACAILAAYELSMQGTQTHQVVTFGAPRPGLDGFAQQYKARGIPTVRYEYEADLIPSLPPFAGWTSVGSKIEIAAPDWWHEVKDKYLSAAFISPTLEIALELDREGVLTHNHDLNEHYKQGICDGVKNWG